MRAKRDAERARAYLERGRVSGAAGGASAGNPSVDGLLLSSGPSKLMLRHMARLLLRHSGDAAKNAL